MEFASFCPESCPPKEAKPISGELFRFAKQLPIGSNDFLTYYEIKGIDAFEPTELCRACGLSVYLAEEDIRAAMKASPYLRNRKVIKARVGKDWGVVQPTGSKSTGHHTWWVALGKNPELVFKVIP